MSSRRRLITVLDLSNSRRDVVGFLLLSIVLGIYDISKISVEITVQDWETMGWSHVMWWCLLLIELIWVVFWSAGVYIDKNGLFPDTSQIIQKYVLSKFFRNFLDIFKHNLLWIFKDDRCVGTTPAFQKLFMFLDGSSTWYRHKVRNKYSKYYGELDRCINLILTLPEWQIIGNVTQ